MLAEHNGGAWIGVLTVKGPKGSFRIKTALSDREKHLILCGGLLASLYGEGSQSIAIQEMKHHDV